MCEAGQIYYSVFLHLRRHEVLLGGDDSGGSVPIVLSGDVPRPLHSRVLQEPGGDSLLRRGQVGQVGNTILSLLNEWDIYGFTARRVLVTIVICHSKLLSYFSIVFVSRYNC